MSETDEDGAATPDADGNGATPDAGGGTGPDADDGRVADAGGSEGAVDVDAGGTTASWRIVRLIGLISVITAVFSFSFAQVYSGPQLAYSLYSLYAISVVSAIFAFVLGAVRYMEEKDREQGVGEPYAEDETVAPPPSTGTGAGGAPDVVANGAASAGGERTTSNQPLPVVLNFYDELAVLDDYFGEDPPEAMERVRNDYDRLKASGRMNRDNIVSDLKATMNPLLTQLERADDEGAEDALAAAEAIDESLLTYIDREPSELLLVESAELFYEGQPIAVPDAQERTVRVKARVRNEGDRTNAKVRLQFLGRDGVQLTDSYLSLGPIAEGQTKELNTSVYVPSIAYGYDVQAREASEQEEFYQM